MIKLRLLNSQKGIITKQQIFIEDFSIIFTQDLQQFFLPANTLYKTADIKPFCPFVNEVDTDQSVD